MMNEILRPESKQKKIYRFVKIKIKGEIYVLCGLLLEHLNKDFF